MKFLVILSDAGSLSAGITTRQGLDKLKSTCEQVHHSEDFLNALSNGENAFFVPQDAQDIESLYDETSVFSISHHTKEAILQAYIKAK